MATAAPAEAGALAVQTLRTVVFMGSARDIAPPWGGAKRAGSPVLKWVLSTLAAREAPVGKEPKASVRHDITVFDPLEVFGEGGALASSGAHLTTPHFFFKEGEAPAPMEAMRQTIKDADCYLVVCPEYNHGIPPALKSMLDHFGGSNYACKPSGRITYSPSPWGGSRAQIALGPVLSELGCLPVSKMCCLPNVGSLFDEHGAPKDADNRSLGQLPALLGQLEWMAVAMKTQRETCGMPA